MIDKLVKIFDDFTKGGRVQELAQLAKELKIVVDNRQSFSIQTTEIKSFNAFSGKGSKRLIGILSKNTTKFKGKIRFYDFLKTKDLETKSLSVMELHVTDFEIDYLRIEPKGAFKKMKGLFVTPASPFPELKGFHKNFEIICEDEDDLYLLKKSVLNLVSELPGITIEALGNYWIIYYPKKIIEVQNIPDILDFGEEIMELILMDDSEDFV